MKHKNGHYQLQCQTCGHCSQYIRKTRAKRIEAEHGIAPYKLGLHRKYKASRGGVRHTPAQRRHKSWHHWYNCYLKSSEWRAKRKEVLRRASGICEQCASAPARDIHHLTYERVGNEELTDLQALCSQCHRAEHKRGGKH